MTALPRFKYTVTVTSRKGVAGLCSPGTDSYAHAARLYSQWLTDIDSDDVTGVEVSISVMNPKTFGHETICASYKTGAARIAPTEERDWFARLTPAEIDRRLAAATAAEGGSK